jgi:hypothetical protein
MCRKSRRFSRSSKLKIAKVKPLDRKRVVVRSSATGLVDGVSEWWGFLSDRHSCSSSCDDVTVSLGLDA